MKEKRKLLISIILIVMVLALSSIGVYYWYNNVYYVSTEDARITGDIVRVNSQISGKLLELDVEEGDSVVKNQILGRQQMTNLPDSSVDLSLLRAPINGTVIKKQGTVGEIVSAGQPLIMLINPSELYISANIEETKLGKIKPGQVVDIAIDQFKSKKYTGKVKSIGQATNSVFSILPTSTSGNFTKVIQKVPVKIEIDKNNSELLPGTNTVIKIHIK